MWANKRNFGILKPVLVVYDENMSVGAFILLKGGFVGINTVTVLCRLWPMVNVLKFRTPKKKKKKKNTLNLFSLLSSEAKGSNQFCKGRQVTNFAKGGNYYIALIASLCKIGYFPHRIFGIFLFEFMIFLYEVLEHLGYRSQVVALSFSKHGTLDQQRLKQCS